jgi:hypothetical protein
MALEKLKFVSESTLDMLWDNVAQHVARYAEGNFDDLAVENGWAIQTATVQVDTEQLSQLQKGATTPEIEVQNSKLLHAALPGMTASLAREERIWVRLTHMEGLEYSRSRWLAGKPVEALEKPVKEHFFARNLTGLRDDNALARLWWNMHVAKLGCPEDPEKALRLVLKSADIRSNFVERTRTVSRPVLAKALIRIMDAEPWVTASEDNFRELMKVMNRDGGGILFEIRSDTEVDTFIMRCCERAQAQLESRLADAA